MNGPAPPAERAPDGQHDDPSQPDRVAPAAGRWRASMRTGFRAFQHRNYRLLWTGQTFSVTGTWMQSLALAWLILTLTDSAFDLALVGAFQFGPTLVLGLAGGLIADRFDKRTILLVTQAVMAVLAGVLALLVATGMVELWHVYLIALLSGIATAVDMPTRQSFVSELVPGDDLVNAVALNAALFNAGRVVGPALAGLILAFSSPAVCFGLNAASFLAPISSLLRMRLVSKPRPPSTASQFERLREGLRYVRTTPAVLLPICMVGLVATFGMNFNVWVPLLAKQDLDVGATGFGVLMSSLGVGSLFGALTLAFTGRGPRRNLMILAAATLGSLEIVLALAGVTGLHFIAAVPLLAGMGFSMSMAMSLANATVQSSAPDELRGRVMSVYMTVFMGTFPIGSLISGVSSDQLGTPASMGIGGVIAVTVAVAVALVSKRMSRSIDRHPGRPISADLARGAAREFGIAGGATQRSFATRRED